MLSPEFDLDAPLELLLEARQIADGTPVFKPSGQSGMTLRRGLTVYLQPAGTEPMRIEGFFLVSPSGHVNQVEDGARLKVRVTPRELRACLDRLAETEEDAFNDK